jgi:hypothetical protein
MIVHGRRELALGRRQSNQKAPSAKPFPPLPFLPGLSHPCLELVPPRTPARTSIPSSDQAFHRLLRRRIERIEMIRLVFPRTGWVVEADDVDGRLARTLVVRRRWVPSEAFTHVQLHPRIEPNEDVSSSLGSSFLLPAPSPVLFPSSAAAAKEVAKGYAN